MTRHDLAWSPALSKAPRLAAELHSGETLDVVAVGDMQPLGPPALMTGGISFRLAGAISHYVMSLNGETIGHRGKWFQMALADF
jgi:hypothetical protein